MDSRIDADQPDASGAGGLDNSDDRLRGPAWPSRSTCAFRGDIFPAVDPLAIQWGAEGAFVWIGGRGQGGAGAGAGSCSATTTRFSSPATSPPATRVVTEGVQRLRPGAPLTFEGDKSAGLAGPLAAG